MTRDETERCTILRGLVGSTAHGLNVNDPIEDRDEMGVCIEPLDAAMSLTSSFEQFIYRSAAELEGLSSARSTAGDLHSTIYSLRKWARLALKGSPTTLLLLFSPESQLVHCDTTGHELRARPRHRLAARARIVSRLSACPDAAAQRRARAEAGASPGARRNVRFRPDEYAMHMLRLGYQGVELLTTGQLSLPMRDAARSDPLMCAGAK